jgi:hypothetical protein
LVAGASLRYRSNQPITSVKNFRKLLMTFPLPKSLPGSFPATWTSSHWQVLTLAGCFKRNRLLVCYGIVHEAVVLADDRDRCPIGDAAR